MNEAADKTDRWLLGSERDAVREWVCSLLIGQYLERHGMNILWIKYEDLIDTPSVVASRIGQFLGAQKIEFTINPRSTKRLSNSKLLADYPNDINELDVRWDEFSPDKIGAFNLSLTSEMLCRDWWSLGRPLCDIGTMENFYDPEIWGAWSHPGYFALSPRFTIPGAKVYAVEVCFRDTFRRIAAVNISARANSTNATVTLHQQDEGALVNIALETPTNADELCLEIFFSGSIHSKEDTRVLGLAVSKYRLLWC